MTSDAKVGLLLGLLFIFIIAFVINGWNSGDEENNNELTGDMIKLQHQPSPIGQQERTAARQLSRMENHYRENTSAQTQSAQSHQISPQNHQRVRTTLPLPKLSEDMQAALRKTKFDTTQPTEPTRQKQTPPIRRDLSKPSDKNITNAPQKQTEEESTKTTEKIRVIKPPKPQWPKMHVVKEGDNLWKIAQKFYGPVEGKKKQAIERILKRNSSKVKAPERIYPGQRLFIPTPPASQQKSALSGPRFRQVQSIGRRHEIDDSNIGEELENYSVKENDSLWSIAEQQLGAGSQYKQILKLNEDKIEDEDQLIVGTILKLPKR